MQAAPRIVVALEQFKGVFLERPDARLSLSDARALSGLDADTCGQLLTALVDVRFLKQEGDGAYRRRDASPAERLSLGTS